MKNLLFLIVSLLFSVESIGQALKPDVISVAGYSYNKVNNQIDCIVSEMLAELNSTTNICMTVVFHQNTLIIDIVYDYEFIFTASAMLNPTSGFVNSKMKVLQAGKSFLESFNVYGQSIIPERIRISEGTDGTWGNNCYGQFSIFAFLPFVGYRIKKKSNGTHDRKNQYAAKQYPEKSIQKIRTEMENNKIKMLSEIGQKITENLTSESITATVYDCVRNLMNSPIFAIGIYNEDLQRLEFTGGIELDEVLPFFYFDLSDNNRLAVHCFKDQKAILISDYMYESIQYLTEVPLPKAGKNPESLLYMPLNHKNKKIGVITVQSFEKKAYNNYHMDILKNLSNYVAIALDNAEAYKHIEKLYNEIESKMRVVELQNQIILDKNIQLVVLNESKDKYLNALNTELKYAAKYVKSLIPSPISSGPIQTQWAYIPSLEIGGDSFGYHQIDEKHIAVYLLDVSGHGIGAALHSVSVINNLKNQLLPNVDYYSPKDVLTKLNKIYQMNRHNSKFFTIWYGVLNTETKELKYASAGHPGALYINENNKPTSLWTDNIFIGGTEDFNFVDDSIILDNFSSLYVYSDGVFEIIRPDKTIWDQSNLDNYLLFNNNDPEKRDLLNLYKHVLDLRLNEHLDDDFSILKLKFNFDQNKI